MPVKHWGASLISLGFAVLVISYGMLVLDYKTFFIGNIAIHEDGRRTFWQTLFYTSHFLREWPMCFLTVLAVMGTWGIHDLKPVASGAAFRKKIFWIGLIGASSVFLISFFRTVYSQGLYGAFLDLAQYHTREGEYLYGSHWRSHFFHMPFIYMAVTSLVFGIRASARAPAPVSGKKNLWRFHLAWFFIFIVLNFIFPPNALVFTDTRYLAHQLREIVTHSLLTVPFALGLLLLIEQKIYEPSSGQNGTSFYFRHFLFWGAPALLLFCGILFQLHGRPVFEAGHEQTRLANLFAAHNFEHCIDYLFVVFLVLLCAGKNIENDSAA